MEPEDDTNPVVGLAIIVVVALLCWGAVIAGVCWLISLF